MFGIFQIFFQEDILAAKGFAGFIFYQFKAVLQLLGIVGAAHTTASAASRSFQNHRIAVLLGFFQCFLQGGKGLGGSRDGGNAAAKGNLFGAQLIAHAGQH